ncbi:T9SS type A sorting domain-containing protein [Polaribacter sp. M15]
MRFIKFLIFGSIILASSSSLAKTIYVAINGNDANNGSINSPYKTFNKAVSVMVAGDICIIREGVYEQQLMINRSGNANNYITFKAADGENVEIKATTTVNGWQLYKNNIYKASVNMGIQSRFRTIYHNRAYMDLARWPNNTDNNRWTVNCASVTGGDGTHFLVNNVPNINWSGGLVYYLGAHSGASWTRPITSNTSNRINFTPVDITDWPFSVHNPTIWRNYPGNNRGQLFLFNKLEALDYAREWYYDDTSKTLYLQTADGNMPANNSVEYATRKYAAQLTGDYIKVEGITFFGGAIKIENRADYNQIINCKVIHGSEGHDSLTNTGAQVGEASIEVLGDFTLIKGCTINHSAVNGIVISGWAADNCTIEENTISNTDYVGIHASPIRTSGDGMKILKNTIFNTGRDGMYVAGNNCEVAYNDISQSQKINSDSGVFYTVGNNSDKNTEIHHNWFHDATAPTYSHHPSDPGKAAGIYLDNDSKGYVVHHNVVWNVSWTGYQVNWNNERLNFYHNTIWNAWGAMDSWDINGPQLDNKIYNNYANTGSWFSKTTNDFDIKNSPIFSSSPFEDVNNQNFMPAEGSALVDAAPSISGFSKYVVGASADIGAYERGSVYWTAGVNAIEDSAPQVPLALTVSSQPNIIYFDDLQNPTKVHSNKDFQVQITGLNPSSAYNLFNQLHNDNASIQIAGFSKQGISGVESITIDINWSFFPNNPVVINNSDTFTWAVSLFEPGVGKQDEATVTGLSLDSSLSTINYVNNAKVKIYPNPTTGKVYVKGVNVNKASFEIFNLRGQKVRSNSTFKGLQKGMYFLKIKVDTKLYIKKVMLQ